MAHRRRVFALILIGSMRAVLHPLGPTLRDALATWRAEIDCARKRCAERELASTGRFMGQDVSLRWIYVHMIEEYARHNGHADLLRERIDGTAGV